MNRFITTDSKYGHIDTIDIPECLRKIMDKFRHRLLISVDKTIRELDYEYSDHYVQDDDPYP